MTISLIRTIILYLIIIISIRLMGKRQISELQTTELVVTLLVSDIAAIPMQNTNLPLVSGLVPIFILVFCEMLLSGLMLKSAKFRKLVCGKPIVIINNGKIEQAEMKRLRMSTEDLSEQLRQLDIFSLEDVAYGIVETNGKLSVLKKPKQTQPTASMLGVIAPDNGIEAVVVSDGEISDSSLSLCGLDRNWLNDTLKGQNTKVEDIFIMTANKKHKFNIIKKEEKK